MEIVSDFIVTSSRSRQVAVQLPTINLLHTIGNVITMVMPLLEYKTYDETMMT